LSELLPNVDKILWIDGDTITFNDLKEMYDIDMKNFHYKGFLDTSPNAVNFFTKKMIIVFVLE
jgi:lipopolysaccharide biosynthesis glycosyltransferase